MVLDYRLKRPHIDLPLVSGILGLFIFFLGFALLIPAGIAYVYDETTWHTFLLSAAIAFGMGGVLFYVFRPTQELRLREGFLVVSLTWLTLSLVGALPFVISGVLPSYTDAVFETMSGLTTTGATILGGETSSGFTNPAIEEVPKSLLFWRSLAHWMGGMGIIVLSIAILPLLGVGGMQLFQAEAPGPETGKLTPRIQETAKLLWMVYAALTGALFLLLWVHPDIDWFEAVNHAFATMATGGFSTSSDSIAHFQSVYVDVVVTVFMFLAGANFALHFRFFTGRSISYFKDHEFGFYAGVCGFFILAISAGLWLTGTYNIGSALRYGSFQAVSIITTTGFGTDNYEVWASLPLLLLLFCFFTGGSTGSTGGGIKMIRWYTLLKSGNRALRQMLHPRAIIPLRIGNRVVEAGILNTIYSFFLIYLLCFSLGAFVLAICGFDLLSALGGSIACLGNIGPGFGDFGPTDHFAAIPYWGKWVMILLMMIGRLEVFTVFILFTRTFWKQ